MKYDPDKHHRRSIRLKGYDYTQSGAYFITLCTWQRQRLFGEIVNNEIQLNNYGEIIQFHWNTLPKHYDYLELDEFIIMPNHVHGIIVLTDNPLCKKRHGLPEIIRGFKTFSARRINKIRYLSGVAVWQRGYYEHIIRNEQSLMAIREYIAKNPLSWEEDELYLDRTPAWDGQIKDLALPMNRIM